jgi:hypothetical protein
MGTRLLLLLGTLVVVVVSVGVGTKIASQTSYLAAVFASFTVLLLGILAVWVPFGMEEGGVRHG